MSPSTAQPEISRATLGVSFKRVLRQPSFVLVCAILLVAAVSLNASVEFLQLHFQKQPVSMRKEFSTFPTKLGPWVQVYEQPMPVDVVHTLATEQFTFRFYVDSRKIAPAQLAMFEASKDEKQRQELLQQLITKQPSAVMDIGLTYYTGMVDTVAHIPDRCYIADGYAPTQYKQPQLPAFENRAGRASGGDLRLITFEDQSADRKSVPKTVGYFFQCNGQYESDPIEVRKRLGNLLERYGYYSKVELMTQMQDSNAAAEIMDDFLKHALPEVEKCLPDWERVKNGAPGSAAAGGAAAAAVATPVANDGKK
jgi:hypothetical protein